MGQGRGTRRGGESGGQRKGAEERGEEDGEGQGEGREGMVSANQARTSSRLHWVLGIRCADERDRAERKRDLDKSQAVAMKKRNDNIAARAEARKNKRLGIKDKGAKKGMKKGRPGFEGKKGKGGGGKKGGASAGAGAGGKAGGAGGKTGGGAGGKGK